MPYPKDTTYIFPDMEAFRIFVMKYLQCYKLKQVSCKSFFLIKSKLFQYDMSI